MTMRFFCILFYLVAWGMEVVSGDGDECSAAASSAYLAQCPVLTSGNKEYVKGSEINDTLSSNDAYEGASEATGKLTNQARTSVSKLRSPNADFYNKTLANIAIYVCDARYPDGIDRCVDKDSLSAAKDDNGNCILVSGVGSCNAIGMCESGGDCYWEPPIAGASDRKPRYTQEDVTTSKDYIQKEYPKSFAPFIIPGVVLAFLSLFSWFIFCCCRCCCGRCWGRDPQREGYTKMQIYLPILFFIGAIICIVIVAGIAFFKNNSITNGINGVFDGANVTLLNLNIFAQNILLPVDKLVDTITNSSDEINARLSDTDWIGGEFDVINAMLTNFSSIYTREIWFPFDGCDPNDNYCFTCPSSICQTAASQVNEASIKMNDAKAILLNTVSTLKDNIGSNADSIKSTLESSSSQVTKLYDFTDDAFSGLEDIKATLGDFDSVRLAGVMAIFILGLFVALLGVLGIIGGLISSKTCIIHSLHMSWIFGAALCVISFLISTVLILIAVIWNDGCTFINIVKQDFTPYSDYASANILNTCFQNKPILNALGLSSKLSFSCLLNDYFNQTSDLDVTNSFSPLTDFGDTVLTYNRTMFGYNATLENDLVQLMQTTTSNSNLDKVTALTPWTTYGDADAGVSCSSRSTMDQPICYMSYRCNLLGASAAITACNQSYVAVYYYEVSFNKVDQLLNGMKGDFTIGGSSVSSQWVSLGYHKSIVNASMNYAANLTHLKDSTINSLKTDVVNSVNENVDRFKCSMQCGWINNSFDVLYKNICDDLLGAAITIALCVFILGLCLIPIVIIAIILQKRLRGVRRTAFSGKVDSKV